MKPAESFRILIVDDNPTIHSDFRKVLESATPKSDPYEQMEALIAGAPTRTVHLPNFEMDSAMQGAEALACVQQAVRDGQPYAVAFVDIRMPPGWDGIETTARLWEVDSDLQVVICTAYADYSLEQMLTQLSHSDRFLLLKKPFDYLEILQLANALSTKWRFAQQAKMRMEELEQRVQERTNELQATNYELQAALANVKLLSGLLPICAACKKIRDEKGYWNRVEQYIQDHTDVKFSHGICPECAFKLYGMTPKDLYT